MLNDPTTPAALRELADRCEKDAKWSEDEAARYADEQEVWAESQAWQDAKELRAIAALARYRASLTARLAFPEPAAALRNAAAAMLAAQLPRRPDQ